MCEMHSFGNESEALLNKGRGATKLLHVPSAEITDGVGLEESRRKIVKRMTQSSGHRVSQ